MPRRTGDVRFGYEVTVRITPLKADTWRDIKEDCAGQVASLLDLLGGRLGDGVVVGAGGGRHEDAVAGGGVQVNRVIADARPRQRHEASLGRFTEVALTRHGHDVLEFGQRHDHILRHE
mgnify:CR=1 FL=1